jgi:hypothetical protein
VFNLFSASILGAGLLASGLLFQSQAAPAQRLSDAGKSAQSKVNDAGIADKADLDSLSIHKLYLDGEFEESIKLLEKALGGKRKFTHADSVFICKHLGVMYTANYETREKGKYYMRMLVMMEPTATILDMYASDMIYMIFKNIKDEIDQARMRPTAGHADTLPRHDPEGSKGHPWIWAGAGAALVAVGATAYFILNEEPGTRHIDAAYPKDNR